MSSAYSISKSDDGLSFRIEWDTHYLNDEQVDVLRKYIGSLQDENDKLRELVKECHELMQDLLAGWTLQPLTVEFMEKRMRELGVEV